MRGVHLKRKLKSEKVTSRANWLLHSNQYTREYYSEHYNRDDQVYNLKC